MKRGHTYFNLLRTLIFIYYTYLRTCECVFKGTENWYRRQENNGWRPITIKTLSAAEDDPVTIATAKTPAVRSGAGSRSGSRIGIGIGTGAGDGVVNGGGGGGGGFHYSKLVREECRVARLKRRVSTYVIYL